MRTLAAIAGITAGIAGTLTIQRYGPAFLWWVFTTDTRSQR